MARPRIPVCAWARCMPNPNLIRVFTEKKIAAQKDFVGGPWTDSLKEAFWNFVSMTTCAREIPGKGSSH